MVEFEGQLSKPEREASMTEVNRLLSALAPDLYRNAKGLLLPDGQLLGGDDSPREKVMVAYVAPRLRYGRNGCLPQGHGHCLESPTTRPHPHLLQEDAEHLYDYPTLSAEIVAAMFISPFYATCDRRLTPGVQLSYIAGSVDKDLDKLWGIPLRREARERKAYLQKAQMALGKFRDKVPQTEVGPAHLGHHH